MQHTKLSSAGTLAAVSLFTALTLLGTSVLRIPTPTFGYVHLGDCFVLLAGLLLGPVYGGLAAGIGSALADLLAGYVVWVPGTFMIKFLTAAAAALLFRRLQNAAQTVSQRQVHKALQTQAGRHLHNAAQALLQSQAQNNPDSETVLPPNTDPEKSRSVSGSARMFLLAAVCGELVMTAGYFLYNILVVSLFSSTAGTGLLAAASLSLAEIPFNLVQGAAGIVLAAVLYPVFSRSLLRTLMPG